jgi:hypothetical protein
MMRFNEFITSVVVTKGESCGFVSLIVVMAKVYLNNETVKEGREEAKNGGTLHQHGWY